MNIDETVDAFRRGALDLDCKKMVLRQRREGGEVYTGPGYIRQTPEGGLTFKLYVIERENVRPMGHLAARMQGVPGQLHGPESFYDLTAVAHDGTTWTASGILPDFNWDMRDETAIGVGRMQSIVAALERDPQSIHYLRLHFFQEYDVPLHRMSPVQERGGDYMVRDRAEFKARDCSFEVRMREGSGETVVEATSDAAFPPSFDLRIQESLQYLTGKSAFWRARIERHGERLTVELASPWRRSSRTQFDPPLSRSSIDFHNHGWALFGRYLAYVATHTEGTHWNPVAYHLYNACESSSGSVDAWAVGVSVAVEAVASLVHLQQDNTDAARVALYQERLRKFVDEQTDLEDLAGRVKGLVGSMGHKRPQDTLYALAKSGHVDEAYIEAWADLRNRHVHPKLKDLKKPDAIDYQDLLDRIHRAEVLLRQLTLYLIGYEGPYTDYGAYNFPSRNYPLKPAGAGATAMSTQDNAAKRQVSAAPHAEGFFNKGEAVYDPDADWKDLQSGMVVHRKDVWRITFLPHEGRLAVDEPLASYPGRLGRHVLIDHSGLGPSRGPAIDAKPWLRIEAATRALLRDSDSYRIELDQLLESLRARTDLDPDLIEDTLKMLVSMGFAAVSTVAGKVLYAAAEFVAEGLARRKYLAAYSDDLLAKSRRIDHLISHTGTVGTYREELLRGTLRQLLPKRFEASTGFIQDCSRQLDIIIWDAMRYSPLFREQEVVVVPSAAVRGIIEVKTTLNTTALDEALEILWDVLRVQPPVIPIFKGIFAFEDGYKAARSVAERIQTFHLGKDKLERSRVYEYLLQGVTAICVPHGTFVFQHYESDPGVADSFPRPYLYGIQHDWPGDLSTAAFLSQVMAYLDLDPAAKLTQRQMFGPVFTELETVKLLDVFGKDWRPHLAPPALGKTLKAAGAQEYVKRVDHFLAGGLAASDLSAGLTDDPREPAAAPAA
jgi:hypothetical protein